MDKDETSSDFEYHESEAQDFGQSHGTQHTHAILAVAAGIKELVEMLRPLVDRQSEQPQGDGSPCTALIPGGHGSERCVLPRGHDGLHRLVDGRSWDDTPKCGHYGPFIAGEGHARPRCKLSRGHTGRHNDGHGMWGVDAETPRSGSAYQTVDEKRCTNLSPLVDSRPTMRCIRLFGHSGECRFPAPVESQPPKPFPWPVVADIEYGPDNSESGRCTATLGDVRCAYRRDQHYPYDRSAPRVHASEYLDGEGAIWR